MCLNGSLLYLFTRQPDPGVDDLLPLLPPSQTHGPPCAWLCLAAPPNPPQLQQNRNGRSTHWHVLKVAAFPTSQFLVHLCSIGHWRLLARLLAVPGRATLSVRSAVESAVSCRRDCCFMSLSQASLACMVPLLLNPPFFSSVP